MFSAPQRCADDARSTPLGHLGQALVKEIDSGNESSGSGSGSGEPTSSTPPPQTSPREIPQSALGESGSRFSICSWRARLVQRAIDQELSTDLLNFECPAASSTHAVEVGSAYPGLRSEEDLLRWLVSVFDARDAGRTERTVTALKSLAQAGEKKRVEDMIALTREGVLALTREGWRMLQERHPSVVPARIFPPGSTPMQTPEQHAARSSRCSTYLVTGWRSARREQAQEYPRQGEAPGNHGAASCTGSVETPSTTDSPCPVSREPSVACSESASIANSSAPGSMTTIPGTDDEDALSEEASYVYVHRDDWELQYMLNGVFDEMRIHLESGRSDYMISLLQGARMRVLEWTVRRWRSCF